jgi:hypothetical protein
VACEQLHQRVEGGALVRTTDPRGES